MENKKVAVVTGGSRGIGKACAVKLAKDGYDIAVVYAGNDKAAEETVNEIKDNAMFAVTIPSEILWDVTSAIVNGTPLEQEPKTGRWIKTIGENGITSAVRCSECGFEDNRYMLFRYCPNCGAKMEGEE